MKGKNKGKIHPSPPLPPVGCGDEGKDILPVLNLLPSAIMAVALVLSLEDREVLAYMMTRSMESSTAAAAAKQSPVAEALAGKKEASKKEGAAHRPPLFHCDCFDCYTAYWLRWDSSASRELIHQAIEAFEDQLDYVHVPARGGNKWKENSGCARCEMPVRKEDEEEDLVMVEFPAAEKVDAAVAVRGGSGHKGLVRKVLPDVVGLINSRMWKLWNPTV